MNRSSSWMAATLAVAVCSVAGAQRAPEPSGSVDILPEAIAWGSTPALPGVQLAWLAGGADRPGLYELRVRLAPGARVPPHTHPDMRCATVLSGTLTAGRGPTVEPEQAKRYPAGSFHCVPAGVVHYVVARDGEVVFQDSGVGPTGTEWVKAP